MKSLYTDINGYQTMISNEFAVLQTIPFFVALSEMSKQLSDRLW